MVPLDQDAAGQLVSRLLEHDDVDLALPALPSNVGPLPWRPERPFGGTRPSAPLEP